MRITVSGKNDIEVTDALRNVVEKKLSKLEKYFNKDADVRVTLGLQRNYHIVEITVPINGMIFRAEEATDDMYSSIDNAVEKLEKQILKHKTKLEKRFANGKSIRFDVIPEIPEENRVEEEKEFEIVKTKKFAIKPMTPDEAILQMNMLGHSFFVFTNAETDELNVVYRRKDGKYGLIEPEV